MNEQLTLFPPSVAERLAIFLAYVRSRTPAHPYDPAHAPIPY